MNYPLPHDLTVSELDALRLLLRAMRTAQRAPGKCSVVVAQYMPELSAPGGCLSLSLIVKEEMKRTLRHHIDHVMEQDSFPIQACLPDASGRTIYDCGCPRLPPLDPARAQNVVDLWPVHYVCRSCNQIGPDAPTEPDQLCSVCIKERTQ